jgi:hypothetical protein
MYMQSIEDAPAKALELLDAAEYFQMAGLKAGDVCVWRIPLMNNFFFWNQEFGAVKII